MQVACVQRLTFAKLQDKDEGMAVQGKGFAQLDDASGFPDTRFPVFLRLLFAVLDELPLSNKKGPSDSPTKS